MIKSQTTRIILFSVCISFLLNLFFGRLITAKISTLPLLNRFKLINPQAPIIINTKEEVRISDSGDVLQALSSAKSKISTVLISSGNQAIAAGTAANLTSDGIFLTTKSVIGSNKPENLTLKLDDGTLVKVLNITADTATNLLILQAKSNNVPVADLGESKKLAPGEKIISIFGSFLNFSPSFSIFYVSSSQKDDFGQARSADFPARAFKIQNQNQIAAGSVLVSGGAAVVGLSDSKGAIISSDVIKDFLGKFLGHEGKVVRTSFGFKYVNLSPAEAKLLSSAEGARLSEIISGSPAQKAGLLSGDIITEVDSKTVAQDSALEELLQNYKPGDKVNFTVFRNKQNITLTLTAAEL